MTRRTFLRSALFCSALARGATRQWKLGLNTYCLRFERWNDRKLMEYCVAQKLDAMFLQDSLDPGVMDPKHWAEVRAWSKDLGLHLETGGSALLGKAPETYAAGVAVLRKDIERAQAMGSPIVRARVANDRYTFPSEGPVDRYVETAVKMLREVRDQVMDAGLMIGIENHKDLQAWQTREVIEAAGKEFVGSYLDTGNPVFVAENPFTTLEELGPHAVSFHLRDSVVYEQPDGIAVQWVPLGEGTVDFKALVARAAEIMPARVNIYCKPITARPPVVIPVWSNEFWSRWFPKARSRDLARFLELAKQGRSYGKGQIVADVPEMREQFMEALKRQQIEHMERSLAYCKNTLNLGARWRA